MMYVQIDASRQSPPEIQRKGDDYILAFDYAEIKLSKLQIEKLGIIFSDFEYYVTLMEEECDG